jgi:phosphatidylserine/phosphatidylglycerophosphate/cardiolipin synthase-like enzyme
MAKLVAFSLLSIAVAGGVIYWALGAHAPVVRAMKAKPAPGPTPPAATQDGVSVYFSPNGGITEALVRQISNAKTSVYVQAAQFTSIPIARALVDAQKRGLDVRVILDRKKDDDDHSQTDRLVDSGVPTFADGRHHTAHNKIMIIDHRLITTGSFNFTRESEADNAENLVMIFDKADLVAAYESNFKLHLGHSKPYEK